MNSERVKNKHLAPWPLRLLCLVGDYSLGHFLTFFLLSFPFFAGLENRLVGLFNSAAGINSFSLGLLLYWHLVTVLMRFGHTVVLGVTPFEFVAGLRNEGPWWWQRLAGAGRVILGGVLDIFLLGNLALVLGRPSFKETSLGCRLLKGEKRVKKTIVLVGISVGLSVLAPLLKDFAILNPLIVSVAEIKKENLVKGGDFKSFKTYRSEKFHFEAFSSLANNRFSLFPDFAYIKVKRKKRVNPYLLVYDHEQKNSGELKVGHSLNLLELLKRGAYGNPLFKIKFPHLYDAINGPLSKSKRKDWTQGQTRRPLLSDEIKGEVKKLIQASFELGSDRVLGHIFEYGPFLRGYIRLRETFVSLLKPGIKPEVDFITMGSMDFLRFRQIFPKDLPFNKGVIETYVPIETPFSATLMMGWDHSLPGALSANSFRKSFLGDAKWFFDYRAVFPFPNNEKEMNAMVLLDFLSKDLSLQGQRELREEYLYQHYYHKCRHFLKEGDKIGHEILKANMIRLSSLFEVKNVSKAKSFSKLFLERWSELYGAFVRQETTYFNL